MFAISPLCLFAATDCMPLHVLCSGSSQNVLSIPSTPSGTVLDVVTACAKAAAVIMGRVIAAFYRADAANCEAVDGYVQFPSPLAAFLSSACSDASNSNSGPPERHVRCAAVFGWCCFFASLSHARYPCPLMRCPQLLGLRQSVIARNIGLVQEFTPATGAFLLAAVTIGLCAQFTE